MNTIDTSKLSVTAGRPYPMGPIVYEEGIRFTIFSRHATRVWVALFDNVEDKEPVWEYEFDRERHRTGDVWSIFVWGAEEGVYFLYRVDGPWAPREGHRYNQKLYLLDPYAKAFVGDIHNGAMKCVAVHDEMDWHDDVRPRIPLKDLVIYETHVRGFTKHPSSDVNNPGTYHGLIEKIPHLKELGVNAVELLPIQEFGETMLGRCGLKTGKQLVNYWGYSNIGFFAPSGRYAVSAVRQEHLDEFRAMIKALHAADIEVILDVVFNHTSEGDERGPTLCFRGIDNSIYYLLSEGAYLNYSGCGNTVNCNHPLVRDFILDCLRYWVAVMHIDGFRFDLASILGRDQNGNVIEDAPLIMRIAEDPVLRDVKLIAEAWDAGGAYQVGGFGNARWAEWNGKYRDDVRRFWRGDPGMRGAFAMRLTGSADLYMRGDRSPEHSINFITCHDGFTLRDLVSYNTKHNEANGEGNVDGADENYSWNCGHEGDTDDPEINALRLRTQKSMIATLFLSLGVPMMLGGDEMNRTQQGNNNAYCQDNEISWFDWTLLQQSRELFSFCKNMIAFRKDNPVFCRKTFFSGGENPNEADVAWFSPSGEDMDWNGNENTLACRVHPKENAGVGLFMIFNGANTPVRFQLPSGDWQVRVNSAASPPEDYFSASDAPTMQGNSFEANDKSVVVLMLPAG